MRYYLSLVTTLTSLPPYLKEYLEFYLLVGVDQFFLHQPEPCEEIDQLLQPYLLKGLVTCSYHKDTSLTSARAESRWILTPAPNEFLVPRNTTTLPILLQQYEGYGKIRVHRQFFDTTRKTPAPAHQTFLQNNLRKTGSKEEVPIAEQMSGGNEKVATLPLQVVQLNHYAPVPNAQYYDSALSRYFPLLRQRLGYHLFPPAYSWHYYRLRYPDLRNHLQTEEQVAQHWLKYGYKEGRQAAFAWQIYLTKNPDLLRQGIRTEEAAVRHWLLKGQREGRPK